jgi:hypothetical protein
VDLLAVTSYTFGRKYSLHLQGEDGDDTGRWKRYLKVEAIPEDGSNIFLRNVGNHLQDYVASQQRSLLSANVKTIVNYEL